MSPLARLLQLSGMLAEDAAEVVASLKSMGLNAPMKAASRIQKAMGELASLDDTDVQRAYEILSGLAAELGDLLDPQSFMAVLLNTVRHKDGLHPKAGTMMGNMIRMAKKYVAHHSADTLWQKLITPR